MALSLLLFITFIRISVLNSALIIKIIIITNAYGLVWSWLNIPVNNFSVMLGWNHHFVGINH